MSAGLPAFLDPLRGAQERHYRGALELARMERLGELLSARTGEVAVSVRVAPGPGDALLVDLGLQAELRTQCQRCLRDMTVSLDLRPRVGIVRSVAQGEQLPEGYEPLVPEEDTEAPVHGAVQLAGLVEDELILAFPIVPMHPLDACPAAQHLEDASQEQAPSAEDNPFAVLSGLKGKSTE